MYFYQEHFDRTSPDKSNKEMRALMHNVDHLNKEDLCIKLVKGISLLPLRLNVNASHIFSGGHSSLEKYIITAINNCEVFDKA